MALDLEVMTGEQLLLMRVLHGPGARPAIDRELDRRASSGTVGPRRARAFGHWPGLAARHSAMRVA